MSPIRRLLALVVLAASLAAAPAGAHRSTVVGSAAQQTNVPGVSSPNIDFVTARPGTTAISGVFSPSAPFFYVSGLESLSIFDVKDPADPRPVGKLVNAVFENEAMTMGERRLPDGKIQRFLLVGNDLAEVAVDSGGVRRGRILGRQLTIVDVTNPADPRVVGMTPDSGVAAAGPLVPPTGDQAGRVTTSTHTVACVTKDCDYAYSAGTDFDPDGTAGPLKKAGRFSIIDLRDLTKPVQVKTVISPAAGPNPVFTSGAGHHWSVDGAGIGTHTGSGGIAVFDVSDPLNPRILEASDPNGIKTPYNDFIHHNAQRPNPLAFEPGRPVDVANGNVLLVTEEDYAQESTGAQETQCSKAGTFQTWEIKSLDPGPFAASNPLLAPSQGTIAPLDIINAPFEGGGGTSTVPVGAFCSAHWFDYHQSGIIAQGYYQQGLRLIDVRNARDLKQFGFFTGGASEVWDAYWAPQRDRNNAVIPGRKTNLVYTVDAVRGVEVFRVKNLPPEMAVSGAATNATSGPSPAPAGQDAGQPGQPGSGGGSGAAQPAPGGIGPTGLPCTQPRSRVGRVSSISGSRVRMRGVASSKTCTIAKVRVAVGRQVTKRRCRFLQADGSFGAARSCRRPRYMNATGTKRWRFAMTVSLPAGAYLLSSRAIDVAGNFEPTAKRQNIVYRQVRRG